MHGCTIGVWRSKRAKVPKMEGMLMWACPLCSWRNYIPETLMNAVKEVEDRNIIKKRQGLKKNLTALKKLCWKPSRCCQRRNDTSNRKRFCP